MQLDQFSWLQTVFAPSVCERRPFWGQQGPIRPLSTTYASLKWKCFEGSAWCVALVVRPTLHIILSVDRVSKLSRRCISVTATASLVSFRTVRWPQMQLQGVSPPVGGIPNCIQHVIGKPYLKSNQPNRFPPQDYISTDVQDSVLFLFILVRASS